MLRTFGPLRPDNCAVLTTDARNIMIAGAIFLAQPDDGGYQPPVVCERRKLTAAERNCPARVQELLAGFHALRAFHLAAGRRQPADWQPVDHGAQVRCVGAVLLTPRGAGGGMVQARLLLARGGLRLVVLAGRWGGRHAAGRGVARAGRLMAPAGAQRRVMV